MYSFNRDVVLISNHRTNQIKNEKNKYNYIEGKLNQRIFYFNEIGNILFKDFDELEEINVDDENIMRTDKNKTCIKFYLTHYKGMLLNAVNEFSYRYSYSISSFIDIQKRCVNITSDKVFNLIWHIFINFVLADVLPEKITFCNDCGAMIENTKKLRKLCVKCEDKSKNRKKSKNKK